MHKVFEVEIVLKKSPIPMTYYKKVELQIWKDENYVNFAVKNLYKRTQNSWEKVSTNKWQ